METKLLKWPSRSPEANPIENFWWLLAQKIYNGIHQSESLDDLKEALTNAWQSIDLVVVLQKLVGSMPRLLLPIIERRENVKSYYVVL